MMHMLSMQTLFQAVAVTYNTDDPENGLEGLAQVSIAMLCSSDCWYYGHRQILLQIIVAAAGY